MILASFCDCPTAATLSLLYHTHTPPRNQRNSPRRGSRGLRSAVSPTLPTPRSLPPLPGSVAGRPSPTADTPSGKMAGRRTSGRKYVGSYQSSAKTLAATGRPSQPTGLPIGATPQTTSPQFQVLARSPTVPQRSHSPPRDITGPPGPYPWPTPQWSFRCR